jgi:hypothetical protein
MQDSGIPSKFSIPWANGASSPYINPVPTPSQQGIKNGAASLTDGFPPNCFIPYASGGAGPFGGDTNGILNQITAWLQWGQAGGPIKYDATFQTEIGGYPAGAIIQSGTTAGEFWFSEVDNNTSDPDTGGANWVNFPIHGQQIISASGNFTVPTGVVSIEVEIWGGGASAGSSADVTHGSGGGGGGGYGRKRIAVTPGQVIAVTIGAGGSGVAGGGGSALNGNAGSLSSFGTYITAAGGTAVNTASTSGGLSGVGGACRGGDLNCNGGDGGTAFQGTGACGGFGGSSGPTGGVRGSNGSIGANGYYPGGGSGGVVDGNSLNGAEGLAIVTW